jgi:hypothetical protein
MPSTANRRSAVRASRAGVDSSIDGTLHQL